MKHEKTFRVRPGDAWNLPVTLNNESDPVFDWTGVIMRLQIKSRANGPIIFEASNGAKAAGVATANFASVSVDTNTLGSATFTVSAAGSQTATWPSGIMALDLNVLISSPSFGPYTPLSARIIVLTDETE